MPRFLIARLALLLAAILPAAAQDSAAPVAQASPPLLRITVTMIQVDAVVTNSSGKHVAGLTSGDFEILQDGVPQKVTYFSYVPGPAPVPAPETPADPKAKGLAGK